MVNTPHTIVKDIITGLCTNDFDGINANKFWEFVDSISKDLDDFTKSVVWSWLLEKNEFEIWRKVKTGNSNTGSSLELEDKTLLPEYQTFFEDNNIEDYIIKVSEDYQSVYLTGVKPKDNILGRMPYELLRIIAKHKEKGINSLDLIKESGQDKRSLTTRLQVLENNLLITKFSVSINKCLTNHMIHFKFAVKDQQSEESATPEYYDRLEIMTHIIEALKKEETKLRLTKDLYEEIKGSQPILKLKWFNKILNFLVDNKFIEMVQVEYTQRFFSAIRYLKDLPSAKDKNNFLEIMREQSNNNSQNNNNNLLGLEEDDEIIDQPNMNRFFPLAHQVYNIIKRNPGVISSTIDTELTGTFNLRQISNVIESLTSSVPQPDQPNAVIGQLVHTGKIKFYRFTIQNILNRRDPNFKFVPPVENKALPMTSKSLFENSILYGNSFAVEKRLKFFKVVDENQNEIYHEIPKGYKGKLGNKMLEGRTSRETLTGTYTSENKWISYDTYTNKAVKKLDEYKAIHKAEIKSIENFNAAINNRMNALEEAKSKEVTPGLANFDVNGSNIVDISATVVDPSVTEKEEESTKSLSTMDYGPEYRRKKLLELTDKNGCICINTDLCSKMSQWMKVGYTVDRRTLIRDTIYLQDQNLLVSEKHENGKFIVKSIKSPPTKRQIEIAMQDSPKTASRKFTSQIQIQNLSVRNESILSRGWKFADKEARLQNAVENAKNRPMRAKRKRVKVLNTPKNEKTADKTGEVDLDISEGTDIVKNNADEDLLEPLMDDRKRKKFKINNRPQVKVAKVFKKIRTSVKVTNEHILRLIKAIVVTQSLSVGGNIDWSTVSKVLDDSYTVDSLKRQWPKHRKMLGQRNLLQAKKNWESTLLDAVSNGIVTSSELDDYDIFKMLDIWKSQGADIFINKMETEILADYDSNFKNQIFKPLKEESGPEIFRESSSMIEKEQSWTGRNFMYSVSQNEHIQLLNECLNPTELQLAKTKLKALFATNSIKFNSKRVKDLFSNIPKEAYSKALTELENEKAIAFLGEDSKIKFTLTDRLMLALECKLDNKFIDSAKRICEVFDELDTSHVAVLLSTRSANGCFAPLFSLISDNDIVVTRVDQKMTSLNSYYTKALDRSKLEADFLISHYKKGAISIPKKVPIPLGGPCSYLWVDLEGDFNEALWHKCVYVLIWSIVFHPGTPLEPLVSRLDPLLEPFEVKRILDWAVMSGNIVAGHYGGYWPTKYWYYVK